LTGVSLPRAADGRLVLAVNVSHSLAAAARYRHQRRVRSIAHALARHRLPPATELRPNAGASDPDCRFVKTAVIGVMVLVGTTFTAIPLPLLTHVV
jgi:hypothetical protein